jgi:hypothetical protein
MALTYIGGELAQLMLGVPGPGDPGVPGDAPVLPARARRPVELPHPAEAGGGGMTLGDWSASATNATDRVLLGLAGYGLAKLFFAGAWSMAMAVDPALRRAVCLHPPL